jgi:hypothetical protein
MKQLILATIAVLSLGIGSAFAQSFAHEAPPHANQGDRVSSRWTPRFVRVSFEQNEDRPSSDDRSG